MELRSLNELRKQRKQLVKMLEYPLRFDRPIEQKIDALCQESIRKHIGEIDAEIRERTGAERSGQDNDMISN